jgi:hypothetical protein
MISVDFWGIDKIFCGELITERLIKLYIACRVFFFKLLFSRSNGLKKGFAIDFGHKPVAFYPVLIILADKAFFLAL